jgi:hypothetical protein
MLNLIHTIVLLQREAEIQDKCQYIKHKKILAEKLNINSQNFSDFIYNSIVWQIYLYYLTDSQLFTRFILPLMKHLLSFLQYSA